MTAPHSDRDRRSDDGRPAPARLLTLRIQGFKSFAERTVVEFGPGISAVVGPNGSGKSNLADGLRWTLGEQGRALRSRRAEDVIFAGSERRAAIGMADVTIALDNADALLPVEFGVVEISRRLYRSGENEYLLNRQRVRLRDLVDLLDAAHLADNAFLFIGQGMVDQALALRPEERRPLFEEVAGVRRHERRRRRAEDQLAESEGNLARVEDILAELRPQARRLAAQAEQQTSRASAAEDLAAALVANAHARWHAASRRVSAAVSARRAASEEVDAIRTELATVEARAAAVAAELAARAAAEGDRRAMYEQARSALAALRLREVRLTGDLEAAERDRARLGDERGATEADLTVQRRAVAQPAIARDVELEASLAEAERALADALAEVGVLRAASKARGEELAALRRAEAARQAEAETARRRLAQAEARFAEERARLDELVTRRAALEGSAATAASALADAVRNVTETTAAHEVARAAAEAAEAERAATTGRAAAAEEAARLVAARLEAVRVALDDEAADAIGRAARSRGGRRLDEELVVEPALRPAVEAVLAEAARAYVISEDALTELDGANGTVLVGGGNGDAATGSEDEARTLLDRVSRLGGGRLDRAIRRDETGLAGRLLARAVWLPDLSAALAVRAILPPGWVAATRDGTSVVGAVAVRLGRRDAVLERREEATRLEGERAAAEAEAARLRQLADAAAATAAVRRRELEAAAAAANRAGADQRRAGEAERQAGRALENAVRESAWHDAQLGRLEQEVERHRAALDEHHPSETERGPAPAGDDPAAEALAAWEARIGDLRARRDRLAAALAEHEGRRREVDAARAAAGARIALDEERLARLDAESAALAEREQARRVELAAVRAECGSAEVAEREATAALDDLRAADAADRERLARADGDAVAGRERLRAAEDRLRAADHEDVEARLVRDGLREQLLVELAALGELGARVLGVAPSTDPDTDDAAALEAGFDALAATWTEVEPAVEAPTPARLATLRRRYHELGAANPFAVEEYAELRTRLESLETQESDLRRAIAGTRELIDELNTLIATQFRATFAALEVAFDGRFRQLFGGGFARLALTDPTDLTATGIEIVAQPPGKKAQALAMLSGGERALTAVALLFAMLEIRPVPFCVLDEVDAALDEANVGRFTDALRGLATRTQFIVITHNRGTIEAADALYGVTVGEDSVSRVISLRLDEAREIADRHRSSEPVEAAAG